MTSLFVTTSEPPRRSVIDWLALNVPPFTDQAWQPRTWWRMTTDAWPGAAADRRDGAHEHCGDREREKKGHALEQHRVDSLSGLLRVSAPSPGSRIGC